MALISFTPINHKNIVLLFFITISVIANVAPLYFDGVQPFDLDIIDYSSQILISLPFLLNKLFKKKKNKKTYLKFSKFDYIIFILMIAIDFIEAIIYIVYDDTLFFSCNLFNRNNMDMILLEILALYTSNTGYFSHHIIGQIIMFIPSIVLDINLIYKNDDKNINFDYKHLLLIFLDCIIQNILLTYKKYLMDIKFISPYTICFTFSFINLLFIFFLQYSIRSINKNFLCLEETCYNIFDFDGYFVNKNYLLSLSLSIICDCIFLYFYYNIFSLFTTSHLIFPFYIYVMIYIIEKAKNDKLNAIGWILLFLAFFCIFFGLFIYLEIIELNFCNLSKNIKIKIAERAREKTIHKAERFTELEEFLEELDNEEKEEGESTFEFLPGYLFKF